MRQLNHYSSNRQKSKNQNVKRTNGNPTPWSVYTLKFLGSEQKSVKSYSTGNVCRTYISKEKATFLISIFSSNASKLSKIEEKIVQKELQRLET